MRQRFMKVSGVRVGSSDKQSHLDAKAALRSNHEMFMASDLRKEIMATPYERKEPTSECIVQVKVFGAWIKCPWSIVKGAQFNNWKY